MCIRDSLREWEKKYTPKQSDEEWNPLFAEALHRKNYIEYLLDILLYGSLAVSYTHLFI